MNINLLQGPGAGTDGAGGVAGDANAALRRHRAWQSAMEQAQLANWFKPDAGTSGAASSAPQARTLTASLLGRPTSGPAPSADAEPQVDAAPQAATASGASQPPTFTPTSDSANAGAAASSVEAQAASERGATPAGERAQSQRHGLPQTPAMTLAQPADAAPQANAPALPVNMTPSPSQSAPVAAAARMAASSAAANAPQPSLPTRMEAPALRLVAAQVGQWLSAPEIEASESSAAADAPAPRMPEQEASDGATRLHVEWTREGARLWLGVDHDQMQRVPTLVDQLQQWLASSGVKLLALVCNGRTVYVARRAFPPSFPSQGDLA